VENPAVHHQLRFSWAGAVAAAVLASAACDASPRAVAGHDAPGVVVDDFDDTVRVGRASRVVSLNPVSTELLVAAGRARQLVGRTHWDRYPADAILVPDLGNGIGPNVEVVLAARPDLVVLYASPANRAAATALRSAGIRTLSIRTDRVADLTRLANAYTSVTGDSAVRQVADSVLRSVEAVRALPRPTIPPRVVWRIGEPPLFVAGQASFLGELIELAGGTNAFGDVAAASPQVSVEEVARRAPDVLLTGPAGAARMATTPAWRAVAAVRAGRLVIVDTALVGRPGVRLGEAARHVRRLIIGEPEP
jgi:ABC-type Fe3+-hydroxamate transport system substrate-binding protein